MSATRRRVGAYHVWREHAQSVGLTTVGPEMVIGVTDRRLVVWSTTFWMNRPDRIVGHVTLAEVAEVATTRHGLVTGLALALTSGQIVELEAMRGRRLRRLATTLQGALPSRPGEQRA
jgi:hypothetical protein